ncbi:hypothetical protein PBCV1_A623aL [Paramecium bursaria Chlorella virus 1]|uniref:Uncharacterized protein n=1 Tax=Paramecium bursaria Chlorella virus 1 TaxID=10506 RepID=F8TU72_PBCV1|nr:hypothetical protein PBCV1_A623aL [Paramecium bursaria Chlorella virus 1]AEI70133.1 hypothetical protein [Paramecium bursaria Chlorella virus 1]
MVSIICVNNLPETVFIHIKSRTSNIADNFIIFMTSPVIISVSTFFYFNDIEYYTPNVTV